MRKFDLSKLKGKVVVNVKTEEDSNAFLEYVYSLGIRWFIRNSTLDSMSLVFKVYNDETCFGLEECGLIYSSIRHQKANGYKILDLSEIEIVEQPSEQEILNKTKEYNSKLIIKEIK